MMNGFDMIKAILRLKPHQNFIVFTSYDTDDNLLKSIKHGAALFLKKPIDIQELRTALIMLTSKNEDKFTSIGEGVSVNLARERVYKDGGEIYLTFLQNKLFWLFVYNLNSLVTYEMIEQFVYEGEPINKNAIQNSVSRLKKQLGVNIKNIFESGYIMFVE